MRIRWRRVSVSMGDDAGNGAYTLEMPEDARLEDLVRVLLRGGCGNGRPIPYTGAGSWWAVRSGDGTLAYVYTDSLGDWRTLYRAFPPDARLRDLGTAEVWGDRPDEEEIDALRVPPAPGSMVLRYSRETPLGTLEVRSDAPLRWGEEPLTGPGEQGFRLVLRMEDAGRGDQRVEARIPGADMRPHAVEGRLKSLRGRRKGLVCRLETWDNAREPEKYGPCRVAGMYSDGFAVTVPQVLKKYARTREFYVVFRMVWGGGSAAT